MKKLVKVLLILLFLSLFVIPVSAQDGNVIYSSHVEGYGWMEAVPETATCGTTGERKRIEAIRVLVENVDPDSHVEYSAHVSDLGWQNYVKDGEDSGTTGQARSLQAFKIRLTGPISEVYDIYYRSHASDFGWFGWAKNDEVSGSTGYNKQLEAFQIVLLPKGSEPPGATGNHCMLKDEIHAGNTGLDDTTGVEYRTYCSNIAWQDPVMNGVTAGTQGQALHVEKLTAQLKNLDGSIEYNTYLSLKGWQNPVKNGAESGLSDSQVHVEGVQFKLVGEASRQFDIYYRTHVSNVGWLGWAKNGNSAGTRQGNVGVEAIELKLVHKGESAPGSMEESYNDYDIYYKTHKKLEAIPGKRTVQNFLAIALQPVGQTSYILGGGRSSPQISIGPAGNHIGVYPQWKTFFDQQNASYDYTRHIYEYNNGLDCIGFVGWTTYNTLNTVSGGPGEIYWSQDQPRMFAQKGYGKFYPFGSVKSYQPGDVISLCNFGHVAIVIGSCSDGSVVIAHAIPPGVMISGTTPRLGKPTQATTLAHKYMKRYYPEYYSRYASQLDMPNNPYLVNDAKFTWGDNFCGDPDNIRNKNAEQVLKILFNDKA